ncbi:protein LEAD-SENSITIVE 1-like [Brassica napus]|uniref:protein LEAD-SENSITIVE 1-like n=1 Tax=Brassica napus TaxID=3708 RepID=UPI00207B08A8|nr:protein LEAD-SENSITIVE 1-like [Brassica napus]
MEEDTWEFEIEITDQKRSIHMFKKSMETWAKESNFGQAECLRVVDSYCEGAGSQNPNVDGNRVLNPGVLVVEEDKSYSSLFSGFYAFHFIGIYVGAGKVIHFTRRGGLEIGTGTYLDKIIQISVPRHGGDNPCPNCGDQSTLDGVISSCLDCFLAGGNLYLFQYDVSKAILVAKQRSGTCTTAPSDPPEEVVHRARYLLSGNGFGEYHLLDNNCEDFAIYCKTGLLVFSVTKSGSSSQVNSVCAAGGVASLALRFLGVGRTAGQAASLVVCPASVVSAAASAISTTLRFVTTGFSAMAVAGYNKYCIGHVAYDVGVRKDIRKVPVEELSTLMAVLEGNILDNDNNDKNVVKLRI